MNREVFLDCFLFRSLSYPEIEALLNCLSSKSAAVENNAFFYLADGELAVLLSGAVFSREREYRRSEVMSGRLSLTARAKSELLVFEAERLFSLCRNSCRFHRVVLGNLAAYRDFDLNSISHYNTIL